MDWQPIETAPKDGTYVILMRLDNELACEVCGGSWNLFPKQGEEGLHGFNAWLDNPTHWMPLPSPPINPKGAA